MKAAVLLIDDENKRDRENFKVASFNINSFSDKLEALDKLIGYGFIHNKSPICPRCNLQVEDNEHILKC
jgi:hypothetical protein